VPWCESCDKNWTPSSANADGTCPVCDSALTGTPGVDHEPVKAPWHFWVGVVAAGGYLVWRAFEGVLLLF
jgi:hypothetical protein